LSAFYILLFWGLSVDFEVIERLYASH